MNEKRLSAYQKLVNTLLACPSSIVEILQANPELLDAGLIKTMLSAVEILAYKGDYNAASWLQNTANKIALGLGKSLKIIDIEAEADLLYWQGLEQQRNNQYKDSLDSSEKALNIYRQTRNSFGEAGALIALGIAYDFTGDYKKAIDCYQQALHIAWKAKNPAFECMCLGNLAKTYCHIGEYTKALEHEKACLDIAQKLKNHHATVTALGGLGTVFYLLGEYKKAIDIHQQQLNLARQISMRFEEMNALGSLGLLLHIIGQDKQAINYYQESLEIAKEIEATAEYASTISHIGAIYNYQGEYDKAIDYHKQSLIIHIKMGNRDGEADALSSLGLAYKSQGKYQQAIEYYQKSLFITREIGARAGEVYDLANLCSIYTLLHQYQKAIKYGQQAVNIAQEINNLRAKGFALDSLGFALLNYGYATPAENALRDAMKAKELLRSGLEDDHNVSLFHIQTDTYSLLQQALLIQYKFQEALEIAERGRTRAFAELLHQRLFINSSKTNDELATISTLQPLTYEQIKQIAQKENITLVEYSVPNLDYLFIWVIQPNGEINFRSFYLKQLREEENIYLSDLVKYAREYLGIEDLRKEIKSTASLESPQAIKNISQPLQRLYQLLIEPITEFLLPDIETPIIFIPQGDLFLIPFAALQDAEGKFLIEKHTIITAPSIQVLELTQKRSTEVPQAFLEALVVGNPNMPIIPLAEVSEQLPNLAWAQIEAKAIANLLSTQAITGDTATKVYIKEQMPKAQIIHLATHGLLDNIRQLGTPGAIALAPSEDDNGFLTADEIISMKLNAQLVVLSACSTGQGKITGDGVIGLSRSLIAAGVNSLIVSLWSVEDQSTAFLMVRFYQNLQHGMKAAVALNEAQRWLLNVTKSEIKAWLVSNKDVIPSTLEKKLLRQIHKLEPDHRPFENPKHWAAFCAIGQ
ncbi:hypothetical protein NIES2101_29895 [Calothrix sp. HK-06]|nr:hypothetical protein NIES2101_29895 [Calothrix sp. HK-06]